jgi:hypothetical protein
MSLAIFCNIHCKYFFFLVLLKVYFASITSFHLVLFLHKVITLSIYYLFVLIHN